MLRFQGLSFDCVLICRNAELEHLGYALPGLCDAFHPKSYVLQLGHDDHVYEWTLKSHSGELLTLFQRMALVGA